MELTSSVEGILRATLLTIDASADDYKNTPPVQMLKVEILRTITLLNAARLEATASRLASFGPDEAARGGLGI